MNANASLMAQLSAMGASTTGNKGGAGGGGGAEEDEEQVAVPFPLQVEDELFTDAMTRMKSFGTAHERLERIGFETDFICLRRVPIPPNLAYAFPPSTQTVFNNKVDNAAAAAVSAIAPQQGSTPVDETRPSSSSSVMPPPAAQPSSDFSPSSPPSTAVATATATKAVPAHLQMQPIASVNRNSLSSLAPHTPQQQQQIAVSMKRSRPSTSGVTAVEGMGGTPQQSYHHHHFATGTAGASGHPLPADMGSPYNSGSLGIGLGGGMHHHHQHQHHNHFQHHFQGGGGGGTSCGFVHRGLVEGGPVTASLASIAHTPEDCGQRQRTALRIIREGLIRNRQLQQQSQSGVAGKAVATARPGSRPITLQAARAVLKHLQRQGVPPSVACLDALVDLAVSQLDSTSSADNKNKNKKRSSGSRLVNSSSAAATAVYGSGGGVVDSDLLGDNTTARSQQQVERRVVQNIKDAIEMFTSAGCQPRQKTVVTAVETLLRLGEVAVGATLIENYQHGYGNDSSSSSGGCGKADGGDSKNGGSTPQSNNTTKNVSASAAATMHATFVRSLWGKFLDAAAAKSTAPAGAASEAADSNNTKNINKKAYDLNLSPENSAACDPSLVNYISLAVEQAVCPCSFCNSRREGSAAAVMTPPPTATTATSSSVGGAAGEGAPAAPPKEKCKTVEWRLLLCRTKLLQSLQLYREAFKKYEQGQRKHHEGGDDGTENGQREGVKEGVNDEDASKDAQNQNQQSRGVDDDDADAAAAVNTDTVDDKVEDTTTAGGPLDNESADVDADKHINERDIHGNDDDQDREENPKVHPPKFDLEGPLDIFFKALDWFRLMSDTQQQQLENEKKKNISSSTSATTTPQAPPVTISAVATITPTASAAAAAAATQSQNNNNNVRNVVSMDLLEGTRGLFSDTIHLLLEAVAIHDRELIIEFTDIISSSGSSSHRSNTNSTNTITTNKSVRFLQLVTTSLSSSEEEDEEGIPVVAEKDGDGDGGNGGGGEKANLSSISVDDGDHGDRFVRRLLPQQHQHPLCRLRPGTRAALLATSHQRLLNVINKSAAAAVAATETTAAATAPASGTVPVEGSVQTAKHGGAASRNEQSSDFLQDIALIVYETSVIWNHGSTATTDSHDSSTESTVSPSRADHDVDPFCFTIMTSFVSDLLRCPILITSGDVTTTAATSGTGAANVLSSGDPDETRPKKEKTYSDKIQAFMQQLMFCQEQTYQQLLQSERLDNRKCQQENVENLQSGKEESSTFERKVAKDSSKATLLTQLLNEYGGVGASPSSAQHYADQNCDVWRSVIRKLLCSFHCRREGSSTASDSQPSSSSTSSFLIDVWVGGGGNSDKNEDIIENGGDTKNRMSHKHSINASVVSEMIEIKQREVETRDAQPTTSGPLMPYCTQYCAEKQALYHFFWNFFAAYSFHSFSAAGQDSDFHHYRKQSGKRGSDIGSGGGGAENEQQHSGGWNDYYFGSSVVADADSADSPTSLEGEYISENSRMLLKNSSANQRLFCTSFGSLVNNVLFLPASTSTSSIAGSSSHHHEMGDGEVVATTDATATVAAAAPAEKMMRKRAPTPAGSAGILQELATIAALSGDLYRLLQVLEQCEVGFCAAAAASSTSTATADHQASSSPSSPAAAAADTSSTTVIKEKKEKKEKREKKDRAATGGVSVKKETRSGFAACEENISGIDTPNGYMIVARLVLTWILWLCSGRCDGYNRRCRGANVDDGKIRLTLDEIETIARLSERLDKFSMQAILYPLTAAAASAGSFSSTAAAAATSSPLLSSSSVTGGVGSSSGDQQSQYELAVQRYETMLGQGRFHSSSSSSSSSISDDNANTSTKQTLTPLRSDTIQRLLARSAAPKQQPSTAAATTSSGQQKTDSIDTSGCYCMVLDASAWKSLVIGGGDIGSDNNNSSSNNKAAAALASQMQVYDAGANSGATVVIGCETLISLSCPPLPSLPQHCTTAKAGADEANNTNAHSAQYTLDSSTTATSTARQRYDCLSLVAMWLRRYPRWFAPLPLSSMVKAAAIFIDQQNDPNDTVMTSYIHELMLCSNSSSAVAGGVNTALPLVPFSVTAATVAAARNSGSADERMPESKTLSLVDWALVWGGAVKRSAHTKKVSLMTGAPDGSVAQQFLQRAEQTDIKPVIPIGVFLKKLMAPKAPPKVVPKVVKK